MITITRGKVASLFIVVLITLAMCGCGQEKESAKSQLVEESPWVSVVDSDEVLYFYPDGTGTVGNDVSGENFTWYAPSDDELQIIDSKAHSSGGGGLTKKRFCSYPGTYRIYLEHKEPNATGLANMNFVVLYINDTNGDVWQFESGLMPLQSIS